MPDQQQQGQGDQGQGTGGQGTGGQGQGDQGQGGQQSGTQQQVTFETWLQQQPEQVRSLYETHTQGLRSALQRERDQHQTLARELRDATQQLEQGSAARQTLEQMTSRAEMAERRAEFYADAVRPEIGCSNPQLAFLAATEAELFDSRGNPKWDQLKEKFPELFGRGQTTTQRAQGNAGAGTGGGTPGGTTSMDDIIRRKAGVAQ